MIVSLALALGLSDTVLNHAGGCRMDSRFIDKGFGALSGDALDKALEVLNGLSWPQKEKNRRAHPHRAGLYGGVCSFL